MYVFDRKKKPLTNVQAMSKVDPAVMQLGKEAYMYCQACHGPNGEGLAPIGPPLAGSEWVLGPAENLIKIQLHGLQGPITVKGQEWNGVMPSSMAILQTDEKVAAVLTYIRNSFGNEAPAVTVEQVAAVKAEGHTGPLTVANLVDPNAPAPAKEEPISEEQQALLDSLANKEAVVEVPTELEDYPDSNIVGNVGFGIWFAVCLIPLAIAIVKGKKS